MKPTEAQIKELWLGCGLKEGTCGWLYHPDRPTNPIHPPIDLNNLFKYAMPNAVEKLMALHMVGYYKALGILFERWLRNIRARMSTEDALFWAIWEVIHEL